MKILLIGECSFLHNILKKGLEERGHHVTTMSDGNGWHDAPRNIDLRRNKRWGKLGGLMVLCKLLRHLPQLCGNDIVQIHNYQFVPLMFRWNTLLLRLLKKLNHRVVKGCFGDDPQVFRRQAMGVPSYSDTYWNGHLQNINIHRERIAEVTMFGAEESWRAISHMSDALVACLYEYWLNYNEEPFAHKLHYIPLPMFLPERNESFSSCVTGMIGSDTVIKVLVGIQPQRDYLKGALKIAAFVEEVSRRHPGDIDIKYVEGVPYDEYLRMLGEADVLVDQLYSYTPSMNSLAAMAYGTVVIGGGEEEYYSFIGEKELRPIINVRPDVPDDENVAAIERAFFTEGLLAKMSRQSLEFVRKYHDYRRVAEEYERLYSSL